LLTNTESRHLILVGLAPNGLGLWLHTRGATEDNYRAIENTQRPLHFNREVHVTGSIDNVDTVLVELLLHSTPETGGGGGGDRDAALLLLLHPVHGGGAVMHFAHLVRQTGIKKHPLGGGGLTGVHMGDDPDIAVPCNWCLTCHCLYPQRYCA